MSRWRLFTGSRKEASKPSSSGNIRHSLLSVAGVSDDIKDLVETIGWSSRQQWFNRRVYPTLIYYTVRFWSIIDSGGVNWVIHKK